ncbi:MAG: FeoB-associated Cys-rich membrane protein [Desulfohalobiaceae bacterium]
MWQSIIVGIILILALGFLARRIYNSIKGISNSGCGCSGCTSCSSPTLDSKPDPGQPCDPENKE